MKKGDEQDHSVTQVNRFTFFLQYPSCCALYTLIPSYFYFPSSTFSHCRYIGFYPFNLQIIILQMRIRSIPFIPYTQHIQYTPLIRIGVVVPAFLIFPTFLLLFQSTLFSGEREPTNYWNGLLFYAHETALFAADATTGEPVWSETGEFYREQRVEDDWKNGRQELSRSTQPSTQPVKHEMSIPHLIRHNRLYVVLPKSGRNPKLGTVLLAFSLKQEGKLIWKMERPIVAIESLVGDDLCIREKNGRLFHLDVATGEPFDE